MKAKIAKISFFIGLTIVIIVHFSGAIMGYLGNIEEMSSIVIAAYEHVKKDSIYWY